MEDFNRLRILQIADELFNDRGYKSVTTNDLAEKLGMSKRTIYQYFSGKEEIAEAVVEQVVQRIAENFDQLEPGPEPLEKIRLLFKQVKAEVARFSPIFLEDIRKFLPQVYQRVSEIRAEKIMYIERCILAAQQMGLVKDTINARVATLVFLEAVQGISRAQFSRQGVSKFEAFEILIDIFISGIATPSS